MVGARSRQPFSSVSRSTATSSSAIRNSSLPTSVSMRKLCGAIPNMRSSFSTLTCRSSERLEIHPWPPSKASATVGREDEPPVGYAQRPADCPTDALRAIPARAPDKSFAFLQSWQSKKDALIQAVKPGDQAHWALRRMGEPSLRSFTAGAISRGTIATPVGQWPPRPTATWYCAPVNKQPEGRSETQIRSLPSELFFGWR